MPKARREHGLRAIEAGRKVLAAETAAGHDPRRSAVRSKAIVEAWFKREIVPKLDAFSLKEIGNATGLSLAACSRIRVGARVPHPRHWDGLLALAEAGN
jgi:hypothetical protein